MSRMFKSITRTWNVHIGCCFDCTYCNAKKAALTRFKHLHRYQDGFTPRLVEEELRRHFKPGEFIFVAYMGDITFASLGCVRRIIERIEAFPRTRFLLQTKNPETFQRWAVEGITLPKNIYCGTTIESNRDYGVTKAPSPYSRYRALAAFPHPRKFVSIEPIMDFDARILLYWLNDIQPQIVEVGADNYHHSLPEPVWWKVEQLLRSLQAFVPKVVEKEGLDRLGLVKKHRGVDKRGKVAGPISRR